MGVLYWLYHVTVFGLIALCLYLALYFGIFGFFLALFQKTEDRKICPLSPVPCPLLFIPIIWAILEYIQSHLFTGLGWALLGYSQYKNLALIQIADFSGVFGVSFVIMLVNVAVWRLISLVTEVRVQKTENRRHPSTSLGAGKTEKTVLYLLSFTILVLTFVYGYGFFRLNEKQTDRAVKVSVIQGNIPQEKKWDPDATEYILERYSMLTKMAALDMPDLIVWPETSFPGFLVSDKKLTAKVLDLAKEIKTPLLVGTNTGKGLKSFNSAVLISEQGRILDKYDKIHLVPFGEYVPFSDRFPILHRLVLGDLGEFSAGDEFKIFKLKTYSLKLTANFATLICFEDIFPELAKGFIKNGAEFLIVITNDAWYGKSGAPYQHAACSVFRAIENRTPVVRCANTGYSCFIDSKGRIYNSVEKQGTHLFITGYKTSTIAVGS